MIKIGIVQFPGSNCERETTLAVQRSGMKPVNILWTTSVDELESLDGFILIGGFSFEDRLRAGAIAAKSKLMKHIITQAQLGKPVLGICNGAQILPSRRNRCCLIKRKPRGRRTLQVPQRWADLEAAPEAGGKWHLDCNSVPHRFRASLRP